MGLATTPARTRSWPMSQSDSSSVIRRLSWYWPMEAANVALVPAAALGAVWWSGERVPPALIYALYPNIAMLAIGALYWRAALKRLQGDAKPMAYWMGWISGLQRFVGVFLFLACGAALVDLWSGGGVTTARIVVLALVVLALAEYVNYYHVQLQYFDNAADFKRLLAGRGFRASHMARDLKAFRTRRTRPKI
jgi:hypothetical protein